MINALGADGSTNVILANPIFKVCPAWGCKTPPVTLRPTHVPTIVTSIPTSNIPVTSFVPQTNPNPPTTSVPQLGQGPPTINNQLMAYDPGGGVGSSGTVADAGSGGAAMSGLTGLFKTVGTALNDLSHPGTDVTAATTTQTQTQPTFTWVIVLIAAFLLWRAL